MSYLVLQGHKIDDLLNSSLSEKIFYKYSYEKHLENTSEYDFIKLDTHLKGIYQIFGGKDNG